MAFIQDIGSAVPKNHIYQSEFAELYSSLAPSQDISRKIKFLTARSAINKRHCVEPDIRKLSQISLSEKLDIYHINAVQLAEEAIINNSSFLAHKDKLTDIITISCTGMQAPGVEIDLINRLGLPTQIKRYNINLMGCYAGITGLRLAHELCKNPNRNILIVSVELCTLHFQNKFNDDYLLSNSLFADGASSVIMSSDQKNSKMKTVDFESRLIPSTLDEMSWKISPDGFLMTLSSEVPKSISQSLEKQKLFNLDSNTVHWSIHPGGKQILDSLQDILNIDSGETAVARNVLANYGNMSSSTIYFVLKEALSNVNKNKYKDMVGCAFGPGLTLEAVLLRNV